jgi:hypothetical protein
MRKDAQPPTGGIYRPRNPRASPLYQCARRHSDELDDGVFLPSGNLFPIHIVLPMLGFINR